MEQLCKSQILNKDQICRSAAANSSCYNYETCAGSAGAVLEVWPFGFQSELGASAELPWHLLLGDCASQPGQLQNKRFWKRRDFFSSFFFACFPFSSLQLARRPLAAAGNQRGLEPERHMSPRQFDCSNISQRLALSKQAPGRINHVARAQLRPGCSRGRQTPKG